MRYLWFVVVLMGTLPMTARTQEPIDIGPNDWPWWRGPQRNGVADPNQKLPVRWSEMTNVRWKAPVPGKGYGSAIVVGEQVFLQTADSEKADQLVLCFDRQSGKLLWQTKVHEGGRIQKANAKNSLASSTPACDGQRVYVNFLHDGAIYTTALSRQGKILWQQKVTEYLLHQGFGSSPAIYQGLVIVSADNKSGKGAIVALERATGKSVWRHDRPKNPNYASPIILNSCGRDQLFMIGCDLVTSLEPLTGKVIWEIPGSTTECVTSTVTDGQLMFTSGGFPKSHMAAVRADGSNKVVWENKTKVYVPSMLIRNGYLYAVQDGGVATCSKCTTGEEVWRGHLGGTFTASPVLVGEQILAVNEAGLSFIFKASPDGFSLLAESQLGSEVLATPTICGNRIYMRVTERGKAPRQEMLYCLGEP